MKKDILVTIRFSKEEKDFISEIKEHEPLFNLSKFVRENLIKRVAEAREAKLKQPDGGIGDLKVG